MATRLGDHLAVREWRPAPDSPERVGVVERLTAPVAADPWPALAPGALAEAQVRPWVLPAVYQRLLADQGQFLAEFARAWRSSSALPGWTSTPTRAWNSKLDAFVRRAQRAITRYEGSLLQLNIGDKGSYLYAAFGAPQAHDDDPGPRGGRRPGTAPASQPNTPTSPPCRSASSRGACGWRSGGPTARTYAMLGDGTNLAARLMGKPSAQKLLSARRLPTPWRRALPRELRLAPQPPLPTGEPDPAPGPQRGQDRPAALRQARRQLTFRATKESGRQPQPTAY